jgi:succinate dehydrogenase / fumarate reductase flavoprotein subunit
VQLDAKIPGGPISEKWTRHRFEMKLVNPANKRKHTVIVVGTGLAGASASATMAELGYNVKTFFIHESARRAHSIAAQGGINAAKNYQNDGDSVYRLFYDTIKGGDFRAREANVHRLAEISPNIIDQCVAQGVPFAREYGGTLTNRSFGGAQVSRTFYARGQTGQQLLLGAYQAMMRQVENKGVTLFPRREMMELVLVNGVARGIIARNLETGALESHAADAVVLATGGYGNVFYLSTNAKLSNVTASWRAHKKGALFGNPCFTQIHPTCIPVSGDYQSKLTLMSESLRNDGRVWVPKAKGDKRPPSEIPESERDYYLERVYPSFGNLAPRDISSRQAKFRVDEGRGVGATGVAVYLDFTTSMRRFGEKALTAAEQSLPQSEREAAIRAKGRKALDDKYENLFQMYEKITGQDASVMMIYPAVHYTMGGLWVDYNLMSTIPGLHVLGEANFSDHGANRLGASALMQGLADGYFVIPYTIGHFLASTVLPAVDTNHDAFKEALASVRTRLDKMMSLKGNKCVDDYHRALGHIMWEQVGMSRSRPGLEKALVDIKKLREEFWQNLSIPGERDYVNPELEKAGRVADFLELGELMALDALTREESCGGHFREEHQTADGEAVRNDQDFCFVSAWEWKGENQKQALQREPLSFENVKLATRSYK